MHSGTTLSPTLELWIEAVDDDEEGVDDVDATRRGATRGGATERREVAGGMSSGTTV